MQRQQLKAIAASRGRPIGSKQTTSRVDAKLRAAIAARAKGRSSEAKSISAVLGVSTHRSITALRPNAKSRT
jgi:hypothetical protein